MSVDRRRWLQAAALACCSPMLPVRAAGNPADGVAASLRQGGVVITFRHADAPGTFDPPGMRLDDCRTQRNLGAAGRALAQAEGGPVAARGPGAARVDRRPRCPPPGPRTPPPKGHIVGQGPPRSPLQKGGMPGPAGGRRSIPSTPMSRR